jgi:hypothetical protein
MKTFTISTNTLLLWSLTTLFSCDSPSGKQPSDQRVQPSIAASDSTASGSAALTLPKCKTPQVPFNPRAGTTFTDTTKADSLTSRYRRHNPNIINCKRGRSYYFNADLVKEILSQPNAVGMRVYNTQDANDVDGVILVPVDAAGNDLVGKVKVAEKALPQLTQYKLGETDMKCPYNCDGSNKLYKADY